MTIENKILEMEMAMAKQMVEKVALSELFFQFLRQSGQDELEWRERLQEVEKEKWDSFLCYVEDKRPELAAHIDKRKISEIPTDSQTT
jgi:hypothetical protein